MEVAPHEVTVLPGGDLTPRGSHQGLEGAQPYGRRPLRSTQKDLGPAHVPGPVSLPDVGNQVRSGFNEGEKCCPQPAMREYPPALGANAAGPACYDTVHVRVVSVVPRAVFGADLGKKEKQDGQGRFTHTHTDTPLGLTLFGNQDKGKTQIETGPPLSQVGHTQSLGWAICKPE